MKVHLADQVKGATNALTKTCLNGRPEEDILISAGSQFETLSGCEVADERNSWDTFKLLVAEDQFNSVDSKMTSNEASENFTVMVSVEDTGIGIPLRAQDRVFMPFMQADSSTSRTHGGTGIGLSISKCLVELMGGHISFISRPQIGSTFSFTAVFGRCKKLVFANLKRPTFEDLPSGFKGLKAIVIDGKPVRAAVTRYHLNRLGINVEVASSINVAAAMCRKNGSLTAGYVQLLAHN